MILKSIKTAAETGIEGIEFVTVDKQVVEIVLGKLRIRKGENYTKGLEVLVEAPFEREERYRLTGKLTGFPDAVSYHATKYEAESAGALLEDSGGKITVELVDVLIGPDGSLVGEADASPKTADIPF